VGVLSGGEKARVALARLLVNPGNCLLMDEPTNHLDIVAAEMLTNALAKYDGTIIFVSHNQAFVNRLATKIWDIKDKSVEEYPGNLREYFDHLDRLSEDNLADQDKNTANHGAVQKNGSRLQKKARKQAEARQRRIRGEKLTPVKKRVEKAEKKISRLEERECEISDLLSDPDTFSDSEKSQPLLEEYAKVKAELESLMSSWEADQEKMEQIMDQLQAQSDD